MDWTGNRRSTFSALGASNHSECERAENDYYATYPPAVKAFLDKSGIVLDNPWEPACGEGHISKVLEEYGYQVRSTDLIDRGYGNGGVDFLEYTQKWEGDIITNPPYSLAMEFINKALALVGTGRKVVMFLKLTFLEGAKRYKELFSKNPPKEIWVFSSRIPCARNGNFNQEGKGKAVCYSWFIWEKGYTGDPAIKWL